MTPNKDPRWDIVASGADYQTFLKSLPDFFLKEAVPKHIKKDAEMAFKMLSFSYFEYEFIDLAFTQFIVCFEKALKSKHKELQNSFVNTAPITSKKKRYLTFEDLINWAFEHNLLEANNTIRAHSLRDLRNGKMHAPTNSLGGFLYLQKTNEPLLYVNDLYEDVDLRRKRKEMTSLLHDTIKSIVARDALWDVNGEMLIVIDALVIFINNKLDKNRYCITLVLAFDLTSLSEGKHITPPSLNLNFDSYETNDLGDIIISQQGEILGILRGSNQHEKALHKMWKDKFDEFGIEGKLGISTLNPELEKLYKIKLLEFYREE